MVEIAGSKHLPLARVFSKLRSAKGKMSKVKIGDATSSEPGHAASEISKSPSPVIPTDFHWQLKEGFKILARTAELSLEGTPLKVPISLLNACVDLLQKVKGNRTSIRNLFQQTSSRLDLVNRALIRAKSQEAAERLSSFASILIQETQDLHALSDRDTSEEILMAEEDIPFIVDSLRRINGHVADLQTDIVMSIERNTDDAIEQLNAIRIESWPRSKHATYGADLDATPLKREACTPNTRVTTLDYIKQWAEDPAPNCPRVFWLNGHAGAGKSTIAFSIAKHYDTTSKLLAANFFCSRQFEDTNKRRYIIPSIVCQLACHSSSFRRALVAVNLGSCDEPDKQMQELLVKPWRKCLRDREFQIPALLIVVDALDEIADGEGICFLQQLFSTVRTGDLDGLRFLVSSRPDPDIVDLCNSFPNATYSLQEVDVAEVDNDIITFLHTKLPSLRYKPQLQELARRCGGLFIYAATAVRYITPRPKMTTGEQFDLLKKFLDSNPTGRLLHDELYEQILWSAFSGLEDTQLFARLRILHAILAIPSPLKAQIVARLDSSFTEELVGLVVSELNAVLYVKADRTISWYHSSFPDFVFDSTRAKFTWDSGAPVDMSCGREARFAFMQRMARLEAAEFIVENQQNQESHVASAPRAPPKHSKNFKDYIRPPISLPNQPRWK
ncbi:hypothetical protein K438DRAFT_1861837 [Mycena galopus ATCC 62051]|nr:hypothetical protein K438DRAFT_1861837 [Mycena galopus ATCC 62051]